MWYGMHACLSLSYTVTNLYYNYDLSVPKSYLNLSLRTRYITNASCSDTVVHFSVHLLIHDRLFLFILCSTNVYSAS